MLTLDQFKLIIAGTSSVTIALGIGRFAYTPILPHMQHSLMMTSTDAGLLSSYNFLGYLLGASVPFLSKYYIGWQREVFFLGLFISIFTTLAMGFTTEHLLLLIIRLIAGIGSGITLVVGTSLIFDKIGESSKPDIRLIHFSGFGVGITLSSIIVPMTASFNFSWQYQWIMVSAVSLILLIPVILFMPYEILKNEPKSKRVIVRNFNFGFTLIAVGYGLFGIGYIIFGTFISAMFFQPKSGILLDQYVWLIVGIGAIPGALIWQKIASITATDISLCLACFTSSLGIFFAVNFLSSHAIAFGCFMYGIGMPGIVALALLEGKRRFSGSLTIAVALLTFAFSLGQIIGPYIAGILIDRNGTYDIAMLISFLTLIIAGLFMINPKRYLTKPQSQS